MKEQHFSQCPTRSGTAVQNITGFRAVKDATTGTEDIRFDVAGASDGALCVGIAIGDATLGDAVGVAFSGPGMVEVNGGSVAIASGDPLKPGASGILVKAATAGDHFIARAMEPATADGLAIRCYIQKGQVADGT